MRGSRIFRQGGPGPSKKKKKKKKKKKALTRFFQSLTYFTEV